MENTHCEPTRPGHATPYSHSLQCQSGSVMRREQEKNNVIMQMIRSMLSLTTPHAKEKFIIHAEDNINVIILLDDKHKMFRKMLNLTSEDYNLVII